MSQSRSKKGRALFCSRDSGGKHEQTPAQYVSWAIRESERLELDFNGTPEEINRMVTDGLAVSGDLYFDYCVSGNELSRPALDALLAEVRRDLRVSHIFIPNRDRLMRPDDAIDGLRLEKEIRECGVTIVYMGLVLGPLKFRERIDIGESISAIVDFHNSGKFRTDLSEKMIYAQLQLAANGYSTGGRAPFGFRRHLVRSDGTLVRQLSDGEVVRQAGHHVMWLPGPQEEVDLLKRILKMLVDLPASRVARILNEEGIPSPDAGRTRTDSGTKHKVQGRWHQSSIVNIGRSSLVRAICKYGQRSMGDQRRMTPHGPRPLEESDVNRRRKPKVIRNSPDQVVSAAARFEPLISPEESIRLTEILDARAGTQRGKSRSRNPDQNPLGGRIFDMKCGWLMYRIPNRGSFRYTCGLYQQSRPRQCSHNHVDGPTATRFGLEVIRQRLLAPGTLEAIKSKLRDRLSARPRNDSAEKGIVALQEELAAVQEQLKTAKRSLAFANSKEQFNDVNDVVEELKSGQKELELKIRMAKAEQSRTQHIDQLAEALSLVDRLPDLASDPSNFPAIRALFQAVDLQMFLNFNRVQKQKSFENKLAGGILTVGNVPSPIEKYCGRTDRRSVHEQYRQAKNPEGEQPSGRLNPTDSDRNDESLGNVNRDDRI